MDILSVCFFLVAGAWLVAALIYSILVLCFLRLRATGQLGSLYDEEFGRVYLMGNCFLPLGCIFRRYARHLQMDDDGGRGQVRFMTRNERRAAMEQLLKIQGPRQEARVNDEAAEAKVESSPTDSTDVEAASDEDGLSIEGPTCSICLDSLEDAYSPATCSHQFCSGCILDWLQRNDNTACPECRVEMVQEDDVWKAVKNLRREKRKQLRLERRKLRKSGSEQNEEDDISETEEMDDEEVTDDMMSV